MNFFYELCTNYHIVAAVASWIVAQILKACTGFFKLQDFSFKALFFGTGGMPSSHTAAACGLCTACVLKNGVGSPLVAISGVLAMIVMIDAAGVRLETGKQSRALNHLLNEKFGDSEDEDAFVRFKELIGHTPLQVFFGALTGIATSMLLYLIPIFSA